MEHLLEELKALMEAFDKSDSTYLSYAQGDVRIKLKKEKAMVFESERPPVQVDFSVSSPSKETKAVELLGLEVRSPIVGVFYAAKEPGAAPFVQTGDVVKKGDVLCILESMKMMNEIKSPADGKILKVCCVNESVVEYNQLLFVLEETNA